MTKPKEINTFRAEEASRLLDRIKLSSKALSDRLVCPEILCCLRWFILTSCRGEKIWILHGNATTFRTDFVHHHPNLTRPKWRLSLRRFSRTMLFYSCFQMEVWWPLSVLKDLCTQMDGLMRKALQLCDDQMSGAVEEVCITFQCLAQSWPTM
jgi:hypothetical protein